MPSNVFASIWTPLKSRLSAAVRDKSLKTAMVVGLLTAIVTLFMPNYYQSEGRILPSDDSKGAGLLGMLPGGLAGAAAMLGAGGPSGPDAGFADILQSRWLGESLLHTTYTYKERSWRFGKEHVVKGTLFDYLDEKNNDLAFKKLGKKFDVNQDTKTNLISITMETDSPELSQAVVHRAIDLLGEFAINHIKTQGGNKAEYSQERIKQIRGDYDQAESNLKAFLIKNRNYAESTDPSVKLYGARLEGDLELRKQLLTSLSIALEQAKMDAQNNIPVVNVLDYGNLPDEKVKPSRALITIFAAFIAGLASLVVRNLDWIRSRLILPS